MRGVDFHAIARREHHAFGKAGQRLDLLRRFRQFVLGKGEPLPQLKRGGAMIDAEAEEHEEISNLKSQIPGLHLAMTQIEMKTMVKPPMARKAVCLGLKLRRHIRTRATR